MNLNNRFINQAMMIPNTIIKREIRYIALKVGVEVIHNF
jgi:hypothetical protein